MPPVVAKESSIIPYTKSLILSLDIIFMEEAFTDF